MRARNRMPNERAQATAGLHLRPTRTRLARRASPRLILKGEEANYYCEILECVTEGDRAFVKMRFSGLHTGIFRGYQPTGKPVYWLGAALFRIEREVITELWVLGDLASLDHVLKNNQVA